MSRTYRFNEEDFVFREEGDRGLLLDRRVNVFYNLSATGAAILRGISQGLSSAEILSRLALFRDAPKRNVLHQDFAEFVEVLIEGGAVEPETESDLPGSGLDPLRALRGEEARFLRRHLPSPGGLVLDIGAGDGPHTSVFSERWVVVSLDRAPRSRGSWQHSTPFVVGDATRLPVRKATASLAVLTGHVLGCLPFPERAAALEEIWAALSPHGRLVLGIWTAEAVGSSEEDLIPVRDRQGVETRLHFFSSDEVEQLKRSHVVLEELFLDRHGEFGGEYALFGLARNTPLDSGL